MPERLKFLLPSNGTQFLSYSLFTLSAVILFACLMITTDVHVIKDWSLRVPTSEIHAGDTVTIVSEYTKLRDVTGKSVRYIECQNHNSAYIRYPLNEAIANRAKGSGGTGIVIKVPETIPGVPTKCKFTVAITYDVYPWKKVNVSNSTNSFTLLPKRDVPQEVSSSQSSPGAQSSQGQVARTIEGQTLQTSLSSPQSTPTTAQSQPNNVQPSVKPDGSPTPADSQPVPPSQPSLISRVGCTVTLRLLC